ncbi:metallo-beta-lactamase superfamily protein [Nitzschia inconspicua]|uniref:Metallo-beta-lactamase superfamily protein n=1 Tax=Nitzschia inconspicua TaxID=303405 RepID=A0A9K3PBG3_9STRA|nr:metallo-beta-lactamase superfamily protein [Nitzschia inconspicua]
MMLADTCQITIGKGLTKESNAKKNENTKKNKNNKNDEMMLIGRSRAGDATAFAIPSLKWMLDCGAMIQGWTPKVIFLTHVHSDHVHFLSHFLVKNIENSTAPPMVYLPKESLPYVKAHLEAYRAMISCGISGEDEDNPMDINLDDYLYPLNPKDEFIIHQAGANKFRVRALQMHHRVPCLGYSIFRISSKLKQEYVGLSAQEIGQLKRNGIEITVEEEEPFLCFLGDTTVKVFEYHPEILQQHHTVVTECSFLDAASYQRAIQTTHMHWDDLQPHVASHPDTMFLLTHFSLKYPTLSIRQLFRNAQFFYQNVHPMLIEREIDEQWAKSNNETDNEEVPPKCLCRICSVVLMSPEAPSR